MVQLDIQVHPAKQQVLVRKAMQAQPAPLDYVVSQVQLDQKVVPLAHKAVAAHKVYKASQVPLAQWEILAPLVPWAGQLVPPAQHPLSQVHKDNKG